MHNRTKEANAAEENRPGREVRGPQRQVLVDGVKVRGAASPLWSLLATLALLLAVVAITARMAAGARFDAMLILAAIVAAIVLALRPLLRNGAVFEPVTPVSADQVPANSVSADSDQADPPSEPPSAESLKKILDSVGGGICGFDRHGRISFVNPAAARLLGSTAASLTGRSAHELLHGATPRSQSCGEDCTSEDCPLRNAAESHLPATGEKSVFRADGSSFPAGYSLVPILDRNRFSGSVLSFHDISQRRAQERLKDEFISTTSHELRTPLTSIRGALGLLSSGVFGPVNGKAANLLRIALDNSNRLVRLVNDILDLERIQGGREPLAFRPVQLDEIVCQAIDGMMPVAEAAGVQLIHDSTQAEIVSDPDRLLQVLTNLLSNAVKFSPSGASVSVLISPGPQGVTLSVIDQGRGIPDDKLEAIFDRFQQLQDSDSRQKGGSGLGLAICRTIVQQHSGRIWAERNPDCGSTFHVFLPLQPALAAVPSADDS
jgi:PAS domain S-box-containing protein